MLIESYAKTRPYLYHLTHRDNLNHIREIGRLFPAATLMERSGKTDLMRIPRRGHKPVTIEGRMIVIRDQDPLHRGHTGLTRGFTFEDHIENLNRRVFFWPGTDAGPIQNGQRHFKRYQQERPVILRIDFRSLLHTNPLAIPGYCKYNSGSPRTVGGKKSPRSPDTFLCAADFQETPSKVVEITFDTEIVLPSTTQFGIHPSGSWEKLI